MEVQTKQVGHCLQLNNEVLNVIQNYTNTLAYSKFLEPIHALQSRHVGYEIEDFIQESIQIILKDFETKTFSSIAKLKCFMAKAMEFHYLKEKRKYWYTHRGLATVVSLEANVSNLDNLNYNDVIPDKEEDTIGNFSLHNIMSKNLFIAIDKSGYRVCRAHELKQYKTSTVLSVNHFIRAQRALGMKDACKFYKEHGLYMTRKHFEQISSILINYMKDNDLLVIDEEEHRYTENRAKASWLQ